jgi:hypothetical protein
MDIAGNIEIRYNYPHAREQGRPLNRSVKSVSCEHMVQVAYNAQHRINWHWELPSYLVTKNIAGGLFMLLSLGAGLGIFAFDPLTFLTVGLAAMVFMLATVILLIKEASRSVSCVLRPQ